MPYRAFSLDAHDVRPADVGITINPAGNVHVAESIAGFVGADTVAVGLAVDIESAKEATLAIDIGTNGELVLAAGASSTPPVVPPVPPWKVHASTTAAGRPKGPSTPSTSPPPTLPLA